MIPERPPAGDFRYRLVGGGLQLQIDDAESLKNVLKLDEAFWVMTGVECDSLRFDSRFLNFVDSDHDGKIRTDEVKQALSFVLAYFRDLSPVISGSGDFRTEYIDPDAQGAEDVIKCAELVLENLGRSRGGSLTVEDLADSDNVISSVIHNGDGVICPEGIDAAAAAEKARVIISSGRKSTDISGNDGISMADIESFQAAVIHRLQGIGIAEKDPQIMIFGDDTAAEYALFHGCESLIEEFFLNQAAGEFLVSIPERSVKGEFSADLMVPESVRKALGSAAVSIPGRSSGLDFNAPLNPLYSAQLRMLASSRHFAKYIKDGVLSAEDFASAKAAFGPYAAWAEEFLTDDGLENISREALEEYAKENAFDDLKALAAEDMSFSSAVSAGTMLMDLILCQQNMLEFLNNFVSLPELFNPDNPSRLQMGKLIMDGRHFTLTVAVKNMAEHKKIVQSSNICVIYVDISCRKGAENVKHLIAAAVTGGTMRSLFIGKRGIFFDTDNVIYDAVIRDIVEQPVSIGEAFKAPFFAFADFIGKQTERIFNTRNAAMQKNITGEFEKSAAVVPAVPAPTLPSAAPAPAANLPMLLMGGGIGVAALGSSVAFIAKSLQNVSWLTIIGVLAGIIIIFGGPSVVISLIKIFRRNLSRFLESCGCAVNRPMRMSRKMGSIFTFVPKRPRGSISLLDPVKIFSPVKKSPVFRTVVIALLILLAGAASGVALTHYVFIRNSAEQPVSEAAGGESCSSEAEKPYQNNTASETLQTGADALTQGE